MGKVYDALRRAEEQRNQRVRETAAAPAAPVAPEVKIPTGAPPERTPAPTLPAMPPHQPIWRRWFARFSRVAPGMESFGAFHAAEVVYVFGNLDQADDQRESPIAWDETARALSETLSAYWTNFARTGDPNGDGLPNWPRYRPPENIRLELGDQIEAIESSSLERYELFDRWFEERTGRTVAAE